jgi:hypothetical protein
MPLEPTTTALLRLDGRTRKGLAWVCRWARGRITGLKRRRKRLPAGQSYGQAEAEALRVLLALEESAKMLLDSAKKNR